MTKKRENKDKLKTKLTKKYRLVVLNEDSFEERFSLKLTRLNVFVLGGLFSVFLIALTVLLIAFTSIKEYVPGFSSTQLKKQATHLFYKVDSLQLQIKTLKKYTEALKPILIGEDKAIGLELPYTNDVKAEVLASVSPNIRDSIRKILKDEYLLKGKILEELHQKELTSINQQLFKKNAIIDSLSFKISAYQQHKMKHINNEVPFESVESSVDQLLVRSKKDSIFREGVEREDRFNLFDFETDKVAVVFFAPVKGIITDHYNVKEKHYAVDIAVTKGATVKAIADGTIIFAEWTAETGYVLIIEHLNKYLSVYKHNEIIYRNQGDLVKSGEVISIAGSSGEYSTGPHLHFEMWYQGYPVNPINFIEFE